MILKLDKGKGTVLVNKIDYYSSLDRLFCDKTKFQVFENDPTLTNHTTIQPYIQILFKRGEITEKEGRK